MKQTSMEMIQGRELAMKYRSDKGKIINKALRNVTLKAEREAKKAAKLTRTSWYKPTGRLAASISHVLSTYEAKIGTMVEYAPFVEFGTKTMRPRHMEGATKQYDVGPFGYTERILADMLPEDERELVKDMQVALSD